MATTTAAKVAAGYLLAGETVELHARRFVVAASPVWASARQVSVTLADAEGREFSTLLRAEVGVAVVDVEAEMADVLSALTGAGA